ncbi:carbon storage regulator [Roseimaritima ulvae]|uniref:Translational regulator CsrA n=1 Tax=Roseimaritima ulvae TaxID=980254 RepID=A0A5B9QUI3_9BACT|nr:carbon storage regulator [Roseimaritima ulvae]QEG41619.1 hypothetical protein UC8_36450 [Roseimaritima ulvae]
MLVLSRKLNEKIQLGDNITVTVLRVQGNTIRLGIDAPRDVRILRGELEPLDNHRKTKDEVFTAISDSGSAEPAASSPTEPQAGKESGESDTDPAAAARSDHRRGQTSVRKTRPSIGKAPASVNNAHSGVSKTQIGAGKPRAAATAAPAAVNGVRPELERALNGRPLASFVAAHKPTGSL